MRQKTIFCGILKPIIGKVIFEYADQKRIEKNNLGAENGTS
jgi:hypothetical protein